MNDFELTVPNLYWQTCGVRCEIQGVSSIFLVPDLVQRPEEVQQTFHKQNQKVNVAWID